MSPIVSLIYFDLSYVWVFSLSLFNYRHYRFDSNLGICLIISIQFGFNLFIKESSCFVNNKRQFDNIIVFVIKFYQLYMLNMVFVQVYETNDFGLFYYSFTIIITFDRACFVFWWLCHIKQIYMHICIIYTNYAVSFYQKR